MHATLFLCCILVMLQEDQGPKTQIPDAIKLEQRTLSARRAIARGEVEFHVVRRLHSGKIEQRYEYRTFFDGQRIRCDMNHPLDSTSHAASAADALAVRTCVLTEDTYLHYYHVNTPSDSAHVLFKHDPKRPNHLSFTRHTVDPRLIGVVPSDPLVLHAKTLESFLALPDRRNTSVARQMIGDLETWRIEYERGDGTQIRMWIAPSQDYSIVRAAVVPESCGGNLVSRIECHNRKYGDPGIWFPHRVRYERFLDGKFYYEVVVTVHAARFNQPVDDKVFTLEGMDIPRGTPVFNLSSRWQGHEMWDGSKIVPVRMHDPAGDLDAEGSEGGVPWRGLTSAVALGLAALLAFFVRWRQRSIKCRLGARGDNRVKGASTALEHEAASNPPSSPHTSDEHAAAAIGRL